MGSTVGVSPITVDGTSFALTGHNVSYRFHVDKDTGDLVTDHFGGYAPEDGLICDPGHPQGWAPALSRSRREFPDSGRGDFRTPAFQIRQSEGSTVSEFKYKSHALVSGKPSLQGLPATFGSDSDVASLKVTLVDEVSSVEAELLYSIFPKYDAIVRSVTVKNTGHDTIVLDKLASFSVDFPYEDLEIIEMKGDWAREGLRVRRKVDVGTQGFQNSTGFSSHLHNPFLSLVSSTTTESQGEAWGFSLVYTGSFAADVEKGSQGLTRAMIGLNPAMFSWPLKASESFTSPEVVSVYSSTGLGGMSRQYHRLFRKHLMKSNFAEKTRPVLLNSWEGTYFDIDEKKITTMAQSAADLGVKLFVMDDGWFGNGKHARIDDLAGLGDWDVNKDRFPQGLEPMVEKITQMKAAGTDQKLQFGIWVEPEMVNPKSDLYEAHPDWAIHAGRYPRTEQRQQLILNLSLPAVQEFIIDAMTKLLESAPITYVKWDHNRGLHEAPSPNLDHEYMIGMYRVFDTLTSKFPDVLWEGCASGGGRFDPGILQSFPQFWTSDDTDALERIGIQFGHSIVYPASAMGAHISACPNSMTGRTQSVTFRAHVAMMGGSFGLELDPKGLTDDERKEMPSILALAEKVNQTVVSGDFYRLVLPEDSNNPAGQFISEDGKQVILFAFQTRCTVNYAQPWFRLQGLDAGARYKIGEKTVSGATLMNVGVQLRFEGDYDSHVVIATRL
ncbi:Melibiase-domain-containing protein [Emericellopsis atlantica]|uniref:Alpha-galactosidase n=1 Tax=Emericellopsis atlantica TaxID=2614577 RepID=A0A9P7ZNZ6_9HYPO|nr:Melibiase-domain-containing protein [Emericellopsis atlantica]KAG9255623.1 Melibiase-domain-containing protein [Emericellopsis atlantica]